MNGLPLAARTAATALRPSVPLLPRPLEGLRELVGAGEGVAPRALLVDVWGVLTDGARAFPPALGALSACRRAGLPVVLVSNTSRRSQALAAMLGRQGIGPAHFDAVVTGGELAFHHVRALAEPRRLQGQPPLRALVLGTQPGGHWAAEAGLVETGDPADADLLLGVGILGGTDEAADPAETLGEDILSILRAAARRSLPMVLTNADERVRLSGRLHAGVGALAAPYRALLGSGAGVSVFGKPGRSVYEAALALASGLRGERLPAGAALMIGDTLATDIAGARALGLATLLVTREGSHAALLHPAPGAALCPAGLASLLEKAGIAPDHVTEALKW